MQIEISRRSLLAGFLLSTVSNILGRAAFAAPTLNVILGRPTQNSIAVSLMSSSALTAYVDYGTSGKTFTSKSIVSPLISNTPVVFELKNLKSDQKYFYRIRYKDETAKTYAISKTYSFQTARSVGKSFAFSLHGDTHPERNGKMFNSELYYVAMGNVASQGNDFHILMGDDFSIGWNVTQRHQRQARDGGVVGRRHRQRFNVVAALRQQAGDPHQGPGLVLEQNRNDHVLRDS